MNPPSRLLALLTELQAHRWRRAADLAAHLSVSIRTIYRDMQVLEAAGVPLVAVPGRGYSLQEDYFLPPLRFTTDEALLLLLGTDLLVRQPERVQQEALQSARTKLTAHLPAATRHKAELLRERLRNAPVNAFDTPTEQVVLGTVARALAEGRVLRFECLQHGVVVHTVCPYGLMEQPGGWVLVGLDRDARRVEHFRLSRMEAVAVLDEAFVRPKGYQPVTPREVEPPKVTVRIRFDLSVARWVEASLAFPVEACVREDDGLYVTVQVAREAEVLPWLLGWGRHAWVLEPASLQQRLLHQAEQLVERYRAVAPTLLF
jgi:predicted DNA-binding transcriptional regulator YafY